MRFAHAFLCLLLFAPASIFAAAAWELFESSTLPSGWSVSGTGGQIRTVSTRSLQGERSLEWSWTQSGATVSWQISPASSGSGNLVFSQWIRLEEPMPGAVLRVQLRSTNGATRSFDMNLEFSGWRTVFVPYSSMQGDATNNIDRVTLALVGAPSSGRLYLDQIILGHPMDERFQYADLQVPFVWENKAKSMWESLVHWHRRKPAPATPTAAEISAVQNLLQIWDAKLVGSGSVTRSTVDGWERELNRYNVRRENGVVRGNQIYYRQYPDNAYPAALANLINGKEGPNAFQDFSTLLFDMARGWHRATDPQLRSRLADMIVLMAEHLLDQGWASGSNQGSLFLLGYQSREYMNAVYLARHIFADAGMLEEMGEAMRWYSQTGSLLDDWTAPSMDFFNTMLQGMLLSILIEPENEIRVAWLRAFSESMGDRILDQGIGDTNGFKPDGTAYHHNGHYPSYATGAISVLGSIFETLHGTPFEIRDEARMRFRTAALATRIYSQKTEWPIGISGRHPFNGNYSSSARVALAALAKYPDPELGTPPDREVASAYVRLWGQPSGDLGTLFQNANISAETLQGFTTFPFANLAIYRGNNWMVSMKGYSRYVWSSEIYAADNRYGRNQSNGTAEILLETGRAASGFRENGWNWNRLPGTTALHLPLNELESPTSSLMLRSTEKLAGGVTNGLDGAFGSILNETRFGHALRARKSYFAADGFLVALGSGIESTHASAPAETTLFQVALGNDRAPITVSTNPGSPIGLFPWTATLNPASPMWLMDPLGNGFWIPPGQKVQLSRTTQSSRQNKTKAATSGDFATGWLDHGIGIDGGSYHYAILPQTTVSQMTHFHGRMASGNPDYQILHHDADLHAVFFPNPSRYGFVIFEPGAWDRVPHLLEADRQSLLWIESAGDQLLLSAANPDLNPGATTNLVTPTSFLIRGLWTMEDQEETHALLWHENRDTRIVFPAKEGATVSVALKRINQPQNWRQEIGSSNSEMVKDFRLATSGVPLFSWQNMSESVNGYIVERAFPANGPFKPIALLDAQESEFWDSDLPPDALAYYRIRQWSSSGLGPASRSFLVHSQIAGVQAYDFLQMNSTAELRARGWTSSGIFSDRDWFFDSAGMFMIDNSTSHTANLVIPFSPSESGQISARMGTANTSLYRAKLELLAGETSLGAIELYSQTAGYLHGASEVSFTDLNWDVTRGGTTRDVSIEWRSIPETNRLEIVLRYNGTTPEASAVNRWEIPNNPAIRPDRIRLTSGTNSVVNRGLVLEKLLIIPGQTSSLGAQYRAWAETFLNDPDAKPQEDANGDGIPNLMEFLWSRDSADPTTKVRPKSNPETAAESVQFIWEVPEFSGVHYRVEATENLTLPWQTIPHSQYPLPEIPGWLQIKTLPPPASQYFYRLGLTVDLDN